ncbi:MAG: hypothetical protein EA394_08120 [Bacteroidia bacterium]|nr:MAG: hypothetical protein EA394_08120 [Bacteroidia bacterium]
MRHFLLFAFLILFAVRLPVYAGKTIHITQEFAFDPYPDKHQLITHDILQTIARGSGKLRAYTSYHYRLDLLVEVDQIGKDIQRVSVYINSSHIQGDTRYRGFDLAHLLLPDRANISLEILDEEGRTVHNKEWKGMDVVSNGELWLETEFRFAGDSDRLHIAFPRYRFYYDHRSSHRFAQWREALLSYYEAGKQLSEVEALITSMDTSNVQLLLLEEFRLCRAERIMGEIRYASFHRWILPGQNDPESILPRYDELFRLARHLRKVYNRSLAAIDSLYYREGIRESMDQSLVKAREMFSAAISYNPLHIPSHLAMAEADLADQNKHNALQRLIPVFTIMHPIGDDKYRLDVTTRKVFSIYFATTDSLLADGRYTESLELLQQAKEFCDHTYAYFDCPPELYKFIAASHRGVYRSFLTVSGRALRNDNTGMAETYTLSAMNYQADHHEYIIDNSEALDMMFMVFSRNRVLADLFELLEDSLSYERNINPARQIAFRFPELYGHVVHSGNHDLLATAVLNYAAVGMPEKSTELLHMLRNAGVEPAAVAYHQRVAGTKTADFYKNQNKADFSPSQYFRESGMEDSWFETFRKYLLEAWK